MMIRRLILLLILLCPTALRAADPPASPRAFDELQKAYGAYVDPTDPLAFPAKVRSLSIDRYNFWRGAKETLAYGVVTCTGLRLWPSRRTPAASRPRAYVSDSWT